MKGAGFPLAFSVWRLAFEVEPPAGPPRGSSTLAECVRACGGPNAKRQTLPIEAAMKGACFSLAFSVWRLAFGVEPPAGPPRGSSALAECDRACGGLNAKRQTLPIERHLSPEAVTR